MLGRFPGTVDGKWGSFSFAKDILIFFLMELMFFEKNKFFQRVGWCSGRNDFYRNSEGVSRNLLQEFAKLVAGICGTCCKIRQNLYQDSGPSDRKKRGFLKPDFCFLEVYVQIVGTDARFSG